MLPFVLSTEPLSNHRFGGSRTPPSLQLDGFVSDNFQIFVDITPAFIPGVEIISSNGALTQTVQTNPKILGVQLDGSIGDVLGTVYFGAEASVLGAEIMSVAGFTSAEGILRNGDAYPVGLFLEMRVGDINVYLDQWTPVVGPTETAWDEIRIEDAYCEV